MQSFLGCAALRNWVNESLFQLFYTQQSSKVREFCSSIRASRVSGRLPENIVTGIPHSNPTHQKMVADNMASQIWALFGQLQGKLGNCLRCNKRDLKWR